MALAIAREPVKEVKSVRLSRRHYETIVDTEEVMTMEETARFFRISVPTLKKMALDGVIPYRKVGNRFLFGRRALIRWVNGEQ